jgi:hypothetical protein
MITKKNAYTTIKSKKKGGRAHFSKKSLALRSSIDRSRGLWYKNQASFWFFWGLAAPDYFQHTPKGMKI